MKESPVLIIRRRLSRSTGAPIPADKREPATFDTKQDYIFGRSTAETQRLILQSALLGPTTRRLLERAGLQAGMRVLDVGCGAGDVSLMIGEMVGRTGRVLGIDHDAKVLATAHERAVGQGLGHVEFQEHALERFDGEAGFDMVFGRYILILRIPTIAAIDSD